MWVIYVLGSLKKKIKIKSNSDILLPNYTHQATRVSDSA